MHLMSCCSPSDFCRGHPQRLLSLTLCCSSVCVSVCLFARGCLCLGVWGFVMWVFMPGGQLVPVLWFLTQHAFPRTSLLVGTFFVRTLPEWFT